MIATRGLHYCLRAMLFVLLLLPVFSSLPTVFAAELFVDPERGAYGPGDTFVATIRLDLAEGECVNATTIELYYPRQWMSASAVSKGDSVLTLFTGEPAVDHDLGVVTFSGGIPAGYCGRILGDPGKTNVLGKVIFNIPGDVAGKDAPTASIPMRVYFGSSTTVLLNDGLGTPAQLKLHSGTFTRATSATGAPNEWLAIVGDDKTPPDVFQVSLQHDTKMFQGKYFIVFSTVDKQTGVHHFEVSEDDPLNFGMTRGKKREVAPIVTATSPYVLLDQELGSRIIVRAIDHAGNIQETILPPQVGIAVESGATQKGSLALWWYGLATLLLSLGIVAYLYRRRTGEQ